MNLVVCVFVFAVLIVAKFEITEISLVLVVFFKAIVVTVIIVIIFAFVSLLINW